MNHFARFGLEPRPWIDPEILKGRFLELSAEVHPDKAAAGERPSCEKEFQDLNASYNVLRDTRARLLHLLELSGTPRLEHVQEVPPAASELFPVVASATSRADRLIKEKAGADSPMLRARTMERTLEEVGYLQDLQNQIIERIGEIQRGLKELNAGWSPAPTETELREVRDASAALGFLDRWRGQLQERIGALTF